MLEPHLAVLHDRLRPCLVDLQLLASRLPDDLDGNLRQRQLRQRERALDGIERRHHERRQSLAQARHLLAISVHADYEGVVAHSLSDGEGDRPRRAHRRVVVLAHDSHRADPLARLVENGPHPSYTAAVEAIGLGGCLAA